MNKGVVRQVTVVVAVLATILVNMSAVLLPLNGLTTKVLSDRFDVYFTPAGYVFSIWSLIYVGLLAYAAFQARTARRGDVVLARIAPPFLVSCAANVAWIFLWHYEHVLASLAAMAVLLLSLIAVYLELAKGGRIAAGRERWTVDGVFSVYLGWVSVATVANVTIVLDNAGWSGWGLSGAAWTTIMLAVGLVLVAAAAVRRADWLYGLVFVWAFAGIAVRNSGNPVMLPAAIATVLALLITLWAARSHRRQWRDASSPPRA